LTSPLVYQWLFIRLSRRFSATFLLALVAYLCGPFPMLVERIVPTIEGWHPVGIAGRAWTTLNLPVVLTALAVVALAAIGFFFSLWAATAVFRLIPPRPAKWHRSSAFQPRPAEPAPPASPLGRYHRLGIILAGGGAKGAYQAGALDALHQFLAEREALGSVRMIAATSIGAWNACFWLADMIGVDGGPCETWWHRIRLSEIVAPTYYLPRARNYVVSAGPWRHAFHSLFRDDARARARLLRHLELPDADGNLRFYLTRTNVERAHLEFSTNREDLLATDNASGRRRPLVPPDRWTRARTIEDLERAVFASMDLPPLFEYARFGDELFEDGGVVENLPIYFGTGIEKCDLLFVFPLNASFVAPASLRSLLYRLQRVMAIRQGALERKALKDVYLYNELAALRDRLERPDERAPLDSEEPVTTPARSEEALHESSRQTLLERAVRRVHRPVQIFAICPDEPLEIETIEFWKTHAAGRAYRLMREYTRYELEKFDFDAPPNWIRVSLVNPQGEIRYMDDF
jgi:predicted acylesterase/phospholipase RssA